MGGELNPAETLVSQDRCHDVGSDIKTGGGRCTEDCAPDCAVGEFAEHGLRMSEKTQGKWQGRILCY